MARLPEDKYGKNVLAFLDLIAVSEGTATSPVTTDEGYDIIVSSVDANGRAIPHRFSDYGYHPFDNPAKRGTALPGNCFKLGPPKVYSTASGRYQLLYRYWLAYTKQLGVAGFQPIIQDIIAVQQIKERAALDLIKAGKISDAILACSNIWASFPGNSYGQNPHKEGVLLAKYESLGGAIA